MDLPFCFTVEYVQLKNVTVDVIIIIVTITVGVKCAPECIKLHHFEGENTFFSGEGAQPLPDPTPTEERIPLSQTPSRRRILGASIRVLSALEPPNHISGYGPERWDPFIRYTLFF